jgi:tetratricopeptide (TPR) repeat protein
LRDAVASRYRAFISYSHKDTRWAKWVHRGLEGFHVGDDLVGRETGLGRVPKSLRPVFRDRDEFTAGHSLSDQTRAALDDSAALVVICSPNAAKSDYVNEEIRLFKSRHPDRLVIPLIVDNVPGDAEPQCFPSALAFKVTSDGTVTTIPDSILAADARKTGDSRDLALAKVVASLIGVPVDDVRKRQALTQAWWIKVTAAVVGVVASLAMVSGFLVFEHRHERAQQAEQSRQLADIQALVEKLASGGQTQGAEGPGRKQAIAKAVEAAQKGAAAGDTRLTDALELLRQGKIKEAEPLFRAVAEEREEASKAAGHEAAEAWRHLGAIAGLADPKKAREAYAHAVALDPDNVDGLLWHGWFEKEAGNLRAAEEAYRRLITVESDKEPGHDVYWARVGLGGIAVARGDLGLAKSSYVDAQKIADRLAKADPNNAGWQRDLSVSYSRVGDVLRAQGNLTDALKYYRDSLAIADRLAKADPNKAGWQGDLSVSYDRVGDVLRAQGDLTEALKSYRESLAIRDRLAKADANNAGWQHDLGISNERIGDVQMAQGDLAAALESYEIKRRVISRLATAEPNNAQWQRDLSVSYQKVGDVLRAEGNLTDALKSYRDSLPIIDRLATADPNNAQWQRDLSVSYQKVGDVLHDQGNLTDALKSYRESLAIRDRLAKADPNNAEWQRERSVIDERLGDIYRRLGQNAEAIAAFERALGAYRAMLSRNPDDAQPLLFSVVPLWKLGELRGKDGRGDLEAALAILRQLATANRLDAKRLSWIPRIVDELKEQK